MKPVSRFTSWGVSLLLGCLSISLPQQANAQTFSRVNVEKPVPPGARVTLEFDRTTFFLGENIIAHFCVENAGTQGFNLSVGGDYRGAPRALRFQVTATNAAGKIVEDPYPNPTCFGGLGGDQNVAVGAKWFQTLSLNAYRDFQAPGEYVVRAQHDLGWKATPAHPLPVAEARFTLKMPSAQQAREIIAATEALPPNPGYLIGEKIKTPWRNYSTFQYPIYLPILRERIKAGKVEFLESVAGLETPEATRLLVELLSSNSKASKEAARLLTKRVPFIPDAMLPGAPKPGAQFTAAQKQRVEITARAWREEFAAPCRVYARNNVSSPDREVLRNAAFILGCIGTNQDLPVVLAALEQRIQLTRKTPRWQTIGQDYNGSNEGWQLQDDCWELIRSAQELRRRGAKLPATPAASSLAVQLKAQSLNRLASDKRPLEQKLSVAQAQGLRSPLPFIRQLAIQSLTPPLYPPSASHITLSPQVRRLLPALLRDGDTSVRAAACDLALTSDDKSLLPHVLQVVSSAQNSWLISSANSAAIRLGGRYEVWRIWANRLDEKKMLQPAIEALSGVVGNQGGYGWDSNKTLTVGELIQLKTRWQKLLTDHRDWLQAGHVFQKSDAKIIKDLFPPQFTLS